MAETCRLSMEASVLLLSFLFYSGFIIPLSSGCSAGKSTKFWICFADIRLIHFHSLNTSCKYNFFLFVRDGRLCLVTREFYKDYCRLEYLTKYSFVPQFAAKMSICAAAGCLHRQISICAAVGGTRIWRNDQISNSSSYTLGSIWNEMLIICFPLWRSSCLWFSQLALMYIQNLTEIATEAKSFLSEKLKENF